VATFEAQVEGLTSLSIDGSSAPTQTELTQFLTDGASEVITAMPSSLRYLCATEDTFTSAAIGSEPEDLVSGDVLQVVRSDGTINQPCRKINYRDAGRASDSDDMKAASATDPVYYIYNGKLNALPASGSCKYLEINRPAVAYGDSSVGNFPDEYEYLIPLYASVKSLQNALGAKSGNSDITTALTAINTELDETQAICDLINTQVDSAVSELAEAATLVDSGVDTATAAITTALGRVNTAVALANTQFDLVNPEVDLANTEVDSEDLEKAQGYMSTAQGYASAGSQYISEAQASLSEAQGYANEVSARTAQVGSQVGVAQGYITAAQGYANEIQTKIGIAQAYGSEAQLRLSIDTTEYSWMEKQQAKLQADYDKGIQIMRGA
jgi:hypothetical protein|tara:strand:- start:144 stop:1292 length:1149 start_codon:yes stop_codon:yes gene_type:complete